MSLRWGPSQCHQFLLPSIIYDYYVRQEFWMGLHFIMIHDLASIFLLHTLNFFMVNVLYIKISWTFFPVSLNILLQYSHIFPYFNWIDSSLMQYILTTVLPLSTPPLSPTSLVSLRSIPPLFPQNITGLKQETIRQGENPHIEAGQVNPIGGNQSLEQAKESEIHPPPLLGVPQETPS